MNLAFSQKWPEKMEKQNGHPTNFVEKILAGMSVNKVRKFYLEEHGISFYDRDAMISLFKEKANYDLNYDLIGECNEKIHSIREGSRWKKGSKIHFIINNRSKFRFQFAPVLKVESVQDIIIDWDSYDIAQEGVPSVIVDGVRLKPETDDIRDLALNDGFKMKSSFGRWFNCETFAQLIHWTDKTYGI